MTERQYQTLKYAFWGSVLVSILFALVGCGSPTAPSYTAQEDLFLSNAQCFSDAMGLNKTLSVKVFDEHRTYCGADGLCGYVACAAWPHGSQIECEREWINKPSSVPHFPAVAAHEVCHISGIWDEQEAAACAREALDTCACGGGA